jgi:hypothetical protein
LAGTAGGACTTSGQFAWPDSSGQILKCNSGTWAVTLGTTGIWSLNGSSAYYSSGNVGIGTATPLAILNPYQSAGTVGNLLGTPGIRVTSLGTAAQVDFGLMQLSGFSGQGFVQGRTVAGGVNGVYINPFGGQIVLGTSSPFVGIGTTVIANAVDINGNASIGYVNTAAPSNGLLVSGNVAIGTNLPQTPLDVRLPGTSSGSVITVGNATSGQYGRIGFSLSTGQPMTVYAAGGGDLSLGANNTEAIHIAQSTNYVGIGTNAPLAKLHVSGGRTYLISNSDPYSMVVSYNSATTGMYIGGTSGGHLQFSNWSGTALMTLTSSGALGIGSSSPNMALDVSGSVHIAPSMALGVFTNALSVQANTTDNGIRYTQDNVGAIWMGHSGVGIIGTDLKALTFKTGINNTTGAVGSSGTERMRIDTSGNVGIGTTIPSAPLHVYGTGLLLDIGNDANSPSYEVLSGGRAAMGWASTAGIPGAYLQGGTAYGVSLIVNGNALTSPSLYINTSGNVGIGTNAPQATLDVTGYARLSLNSSQPVACSSTNQGAFALNHLAQACACNGSTWIFADSTGAACSW